MTRKRRVLLAGGAIALAGGALAWFLWQRSRPAASPQSLLGRLPKRNAAILYVDFAALRRNGLLQRLAAGAMNAEPEYREFVAATHFDYTSDLDLAVASFAPSGKYFLLRGRFDWPKLRAYSAAGGGSCTGGLCRMPGSTPERKISFLPLRTDVMALAVSPDDAAAEALRQAEPGGQPEAVPAEPLWLRVPGALLGGGSEFPTGTRMFAGILENAESLTLSLGQEGDHFALRMNVLCRSGEEARTLAGSLERATATLRQMIAREGQKPNPRDLSGLLTAGTFRREGSRVFGHWPMAPVLLDGLLGGPGS